MKHLLIANRGEIAIRIARAAAELEITTTALYSEDDDRSLHVQSADHKVGLKGKGVPAYLDIEQIIKVAQDAGCDAVHPGYGFLAENAQFARRCGEAGITFVGPSPELLDLFGDKVRAREFARTHGVPLLPGTREATSLPEAIASFASLGPDSAMMIKAVAGGGGIPVVFVPGFGEEAVEHLPFIEALRPRRCIVVDLRGRGRSDVPEFGYGMEEHAADLDAVIRETGLKRIHLVSYSRGTTYAMRWATTHHGYLQSYTIGDYPAAQIIPPDWLPPKAEKSKWRGRPVSERMPVPAIRRLFADAVKTDMREDLRRLHCPMLVVRGGAQGAMLDAATAERYRQVVAQLTIETFEQSAQDLWQPDPLRFARTLAQFLDSNEPGGP